MALETGTYISDLVVTNPPAADPKSQGDDHIRLLKSTIKVTFANITGAVTASHTELNKLTGATVSTAELNKLTGATVLTADLNKLTGGTFSGTELNYLTGVTSGIQAQFNAMDAAKGNKSGATWTGTHDFTAATVTVATPTLGAHAVTKTYADGLSFAAALPAQVGNSGKVISTNGTTASWIEPSFPDNRFRITGSADATKVVAFEVDTNVPTGTTVTLTAGGSSGTIATTADILAASVGTHTVSVYTGNGHGSTNTFIRRYTTTLTNTGTAITYADSATLGASFTINENGLYAITMNDSGGAVIAFGASVNSTVTTLSVPAANRLFFAGGATSTIGIGTAVVRLTAGAVVRPNTDGTPTSGTTAATFTITKVAS